MQYNTYCGMTLTLKECIVLIYNHLHNLYGRCKCIFYIFMGFQPILDILQGQGEKKNILVFDIGDHRTTRVFASMSTHVAYLNKRIR